MKFTGGKKTHKNTGGVTSATGPTQMFIHVQIRGTRHNWSITGEDVAPQNSFFKLIQMAYKTGAFRPLGFQPCGVCSYQNKCGLTIVKMYLIEEK